MLFYNDDSFLWMKFFLFLLTISLAMFLFGVVGRRILKVERKKMFSYNHLNEQHKKIDWIIRIISIVVLIIGGIVNISRHPLPPILFLQPYILMFLFILMTEIVTAIMEWKYAKNRNAYIFTVAQLIFIILILLTIFMTDFFGLFG